MDEGFNLGSAYVMLGADITELKRQLKEAESAATQTATKISGGFQQKMAGMAQGVQKFASAWMALPVAIGAGIFAVQQMAAEFGRLYNMAKEGAKDLRMEETFRNVASSVGADADAMTARMVRATGRAVQETELQATAMRGILGGINEKTLTDLSGAAKVFARSTGQATGDVFNQMVNSVIMQMPRQLMRLRVITREEMREIQKAISMGAIGKEDIAAEIVRKAKERGEQMKVSAYDMYSAFSRFGRAWDELIEIGGKLMALVFVPLLEILGPTIDLITGFGNVLLGVLLPVLKPVFQGIKEIGEMAYETADRLKGLWDEVDKGKKTLEDLAGEGPIMGLLLTSMRGWKNLAEAIQAAVDALEKWQRLINESKAGGEQMSPLGNKPSNTFFDRPTLVPWLGSESVAKRDAAETEKLHTTSLLAQRAREVQYEQANLKMKLEVAKQENAIKLEMVKARHGAELKLFDIQSKHQIEMAKRGGASSLDAFNMEMASQAKKNSMTEQNARKEAGLKASIARQEMELEIQIENEKNRYKAETMERERQLAEKTAPGSAAAYAKLQELNAFVTHYKKLENITREGKERIIRARYGGDVEKARLDAEVAKQELQTRQQEQGSLEHMKAAALEQTVRLQKMEFDTRMKTLDIEDRLAVIQMEKESGLVDEITAQERILAIEIERYNQFKKEETAIQEMADALEKATGKRFDPFKDALADLLEMNKGIQNNSAYNDEIKKAWDEIVERIIKSREQLQKQGLELEKNVNLTDKMKRDIIVGAGPAGGRMWVTEQYARVREELQKLAKADLGQTELAQIQADKIREIDMQLAAYRLETATSLNEAFVAKSQVMLNDIRNAYTVWATEVADAMQRGFADFFFDAMEGKIKHFEDYLKAFTTSMNRAIADFMSKKFTGEILKLVFGIDETQNIQAKTINAAVLNVDQVVGLDAITAAIKGGVEAGAAVGGRTLDTATAVAKGIEAGADVGQINNSTEVATAIIKGVEAGADLAGGASTELAKVITETIGGEKVQTVALSSVEAMSVSTLYVTNMPQLASLGGGQEAAVVESSGFTGAISDMWTGVKNWFGGLDIFHEGGVVGASSDVKKVEAAAGLKPDEVVAVLQKGEVVIPKGGVSEFVEKFAGARAGGGWVEQALAYLIGESGREMFVPRSLEAEREAMWAEQSGELSYPERWSSKAKRFERQRWMDRFAEMLEGIPGRAEGGPVQQGMAYLGGERGREGFITNAMARKAEEAWAAKRVAAMEAKDLAKYKEEYDKYRKYELEREAWEREQKAKQQQEGGGLASLLPTLLSYAALSDTVKGLVVSGAYTIGDLLGITSVIGPTVGGASAGAGVTMGSFMELEAASMLGEAPVAGYTLTAAEAEAISAGIAAGADIGAGTGVAAVGTEALTASTLAQFGAALPGIGVAMAGTAAVGMGMVSLMNAITGIGSDPGITEDPTQYLIDKYTSDEQRGSTPLYLELLRRGVQFTTAPDPNFTVAYSTFQAGGGQISPTGLVAPTQAQFDTYYNDMGLGGVGKGGYVYADVAAQGGDFSAGKRILVGEIGRELFIPHYALGGEIAAKKVSLIGERGPELFIPQESGTIIPNNITEKLINSGAFSADSSGGWVGNTLMDRLSTMAQGPEIMMRAAGGPVDHGSHYIVGEMGRELFLPKFHNGGVVGGPNMVPNQIVNVTNRVEGGQKETPTVIHNNATVSVQSLDGADAYRVLSNNRDALASIFSEMRLDNNSRLRR